MYPAQAPDVSIPVIGVREWAVVTDGLGYGSAVDEFEVGHGESFSN
jgi:hypothetical protein